MNPMHVLKLTLRTKYIQQKSDLIAHCESKFFQLSNELKEIKDWDKKQIVIDERYKLINDCVRKLGNMDKDIISKIRGKE